MTGVKHMHEHARGSGLCLTQNAPQRDKIAKNGTLRRVQVFVILSKVQFLPFKPTWGSYFCMKCQFSESLRSRASIPLLHTNDTFYTVPVLLGNPKISFLTGFGPFFTIFPCVNPQNGVRGV